jgi:hypothetical protein
MHSMDAERTRFRGLLTGRDTLDTATASETANSGLGDTLDVVTKNLAMTLGSALSETLSTLSTCVAVSTMWNRKILVATRQAIATKMEY